MLKKENDILSTGSGAAFNSEAIRLFRYQQAHNPVYREWTDLLKIDPGQVNHYTDIPFLPIEFFKTRKVLCQEPTDEMTVFTSSSTTGAPSYHYVPDVSLYEQSFLEGFRLFYGEPRDYCILALLPDYLSRKGSSLVYMFRELIRLSAHPLSGFFLDDMETLKNNIAVLSAAGTKTLLLGVSYALMDLAESGVKLPPSFTVMETGGMKGKRREMLKAELHEWLKEGFGVASVHSEYGMTELLSQAYSTGDGLFDAPPWMRFLVREVDDPLALKTDGRTGGINVIDLANRASCAFIATKDLGRLHGNRLELMGRYDNSDVRGCNLMFSGT